MAQSSTASSAAMTPRVRTSAAWGAGPPPPVTTGGVPLPLDGVAVVVTVDADEVVDVEAGLARSSSELNGGG